jgi:hypothetical protein
MRQALYYRSPFSNLTGPIFLAFKKMGAFFVLALHRVAALRLPYF